MRFRATIIAVVLLGAVGLIALAATRSPQPGPDAEAAAGWAYTGRSVDQEVAVAITASATEATAYVCDGTEIGAWLKGTVTGDQIDLTGTDGARLTGTLGDGTVVGAVTAGGAEHSFVAALSPAPAGLYKTTVMLGGQENSIGWIVLANGEQVGTRKVIDNGGNGGNGRRIRKAERLDTERVVTEVDGVTVAVEPIRY